MHDDLWDLMSGIFVPRERPADWGDWPRPLDDADQPQVERDPPDRPGTRCGAERQGSPVHRPGLGQ
ncbi:hypothetical protein D3C71_1948440 [compost metagenome]